MSTIWPDALPEGGGPKYKTVAKLIRDAVASGGLLVDEKLPPVRELAWTLGITPGTVARAYTILTEEGLLLAEVGRGTFVAPERKSVRDDIWFQRAEPVEAEVATLFSPRMPDVGQVAAIRRAMNKVAEGPAELFLNYPTRQAHEGAREAIVDWLCDVPLGGFSAQDVVLTHGGQNAISLIFQAVLKGPTPVILVEDLSYAGFRRAAEILRADVRGMAMDAQGVIPEALDAAIRSTGAQIFCTSPEVQNPTGICTPLERRRALADVCLHHGVFILDDDCYGMGAPQAASYRALAPELAWYVSSISKTLTPALRLGFVVAPRGHVSDLRRVAEYSFFGLSQPLVEVGRLLLSDPQSRALTEAARQRLNAYVEVTVNTLGGFDLGWARNVPFVWLRLPAGWRSAAFCRAAEGAGVLIRSADEFALRDGRAPNAVRIAMNAHIGLQSFEAAMGRLRDLLINPPEQISV